MRPLNRMVVKETTLHILSRGGRYDATLHRVLEDKQLSADTAFECLLSLPATEYQTAQKIPYQPGRLQYIFPLYNIEIKFVQGICFYISLTG